METYPRDLVGYGPTPPDPKWPNGARVAVQFVLNYEEGSEHSVLDGDDHAETFSELPVSSMGPGRRDPIIESLYEFGSRVGVWRVLNAFTERNLPLTVFGCALALERNPAVAKAIADAGSDVCCHGWRWIGHHSLKEDEEREIIRKSVESLRRTVGTRPLGWYCRYSPSENTRRLVVEEGGFLYDSDSYSDELPYWLEVEGKPHLVVPYTFANNDQRFLSVPPLSLAGDFFQYLKDAFDVHYREGDSHTGMMSVGLHARIIGHTGRIGGLERFLDYVMEFDDVWICRRVDVAKHWIETHPA